MTEKNESTSSEPGRPAWAAGLLLSPDMTRASDRRLELTAGLKATMHPILRRLADAETRVAELTDLLAQAQRDYIARAFPSPEGCGDPDFLIESDGSKWRLVDAVEGLYARTDGSFPGFTPDRTKIERSAEGPVRAVWK